MKIFKAAQVSSIDAYTIENEPIKSIDLMERASLRLAGWHVRHFHTDQKLIIFAGPGNNGGDALAMARLLAHRQYRVECYLLMFGSPSADNTINKERLLAQGLVPLVELMEEEELPHLDSRDVLVDGIFGSGLTRPPAGLAAAAIKHINQHKGTIISIDIPSGLSGEDNSAGDYLNVVRASYTLTFQFPFLSFFFESNDSSVGQWRVHDIKLHPRIIRDTYTPYQTLEKPEISSLIPPRNRFSHKGDYGHALLISGSYGMMGAALLAGEACMRSGAGLVTIHVPRFGYQTIQTGCPEAIVSLDQSDILFSEPPDLEPYAAVGIGPGLGNKANSAKGLKKLLEQCRVPLLIDADGLNILSQNPEWFKLLPEGSILTPHPKEFDRLAGKSENGYERHLKQLAFAKKYRVIVILKGAYTGIATPDGSYWFNTTGNPGMASGGSGDVLTGLITGLLASGLQAIDAAKAGVYLHGMAGDLAARTWGQEAMIARDLLANLGAAFTELKR